MSKIFIDPGHGGHDPGAIGSRSKEKDNVLKVAKKLKAKLEKYGHTVKLSRSTDVFITLTNRANMANDWGADIFVSLHDNAAVKSVSGFETFIYNGNVSNKTKQYQKAIHDVLVKGIGINDRGERRANFAVLRQSKMPAILIEYAFITNKGDEDILINQVDNLAKWTCEGIVDSLGGSIKAKPTKPASKPKASSYKGNSLVDYLKSIGQNSGFANRKKLAAQNGINNHQGTASQNTALLNKLRSGSTVASKPKGNQKTTSVVDYLKSINVNSGYANRKKLAAQYGIRNYTGTASQNNQLLNRLRK